MEYLVWFEETGFSIWMRESGLAFFGSLILHALGMGFIVGVHIAMDLRVLGVASDVPLSLMRRFRPVMWVALAVVTVSGLLLLAAYPTKALTNPVFYLKLLAATGALLIGRSMLRGVMKDSAHDSGRLQGRVRSLAALSIALWVATITSGRFLAYTYTILMASDPR
jgi:uncharacterized membrane protein